MGLPYLENKKMTKIEFQQRMMNKVGTTENGMKWICANKTMKATIKLVAEHFNMPVEKIDVVKHKHGGNMFFIKGERSKQLGARLPKHAMSVAWVAV